MNFRSVAFMFAFFLCQGIDGKAYKETEMVSVMANTIAPYNNPAETYRYNSLPFCKPEGLRRPKHDPSYRLAGDRAVPSAYEINFLVDAPWKRVCSTSLSPNDVRTFINAIKKDMIFELFVDGLAVHGYVGTQKHILDDYQDHVHNTSQYYLFCHYDFSIAANQNHVIAVNLTTDPTKQVLLDWSKTNMEDVDVEFSYSVRWVETQVSYANRNTLHIRPSIPDNAIEIHWLSIVNSFVLVILLTAFLAIIVTRILRKDISRYTDQADDEAGEDIDDSGWKQVHGDVFRVPPNIMLFSAAIGNGAQVLVMTIAILCLALGGFFDPGNRGTMYTALVALHAPTAGIAGYVSTKLYTQLGGKNWATIAVLTASLFSMPFLFTFSVINTVAIYYNSTSAVPFLTILGITLLWVIVTVPLTVVGAYFGRRATKMDVPCKTNRAPREIPPRPWYRQPPVQMFMAGFLPFTAIYIELHYIFASVWGHRVYTLFGVLSLAFILLLIVTASITIALTYFQLTVEDYRWWWRSFVSGGSTGFFIYAYAIFYYIYRSQMTGVLQGTFFFGYVLMISYAFFLMLGTVGFFGTLKFVKHIYSVIKSD